MRAQISWRYFLVAVGLVSGSLCIPHEAAASPQQRINEGYAVPLSFQPNKGQTDSQVKFLSRGRGYTLFLTATEAIVSMRYGDRGMRTPECGIEQVPGVLTSGNLHGQIASR